MVVQVAAQIVGQFVQVRAGDEGAFVQHDAVVVIHMGKAAFKPVMEHSARADVGAHGSHQGFEGWSVAGSWQWQGLVMLIGVQTIPGPQRDDVSAE
jgi:hypothetical protein